MEWISTKSSLPVDNSWDNKYYAIALDDQRIEIAEMSPFGWCICSGNIAHEAASHWTELFHPRETQTVPEIS